MKNAVIVAFLLAGSGNALAGEWYAGFGFGSSKSLDASANIDASLGGLAGSGISSSYSADQGARAFSLLTGYQINSDFGLEADYDYLGVYQINVAASGFGAAVSGTEEDTVSAISLSAVLNAPINQSFSIYGKAGLAQTTNDMTCSVTGASCSSTSDTKSGPVLGIGGNMNFNGSAIRLEYDRINDVGDKNNEYTAGNFSLFKFEALYFF